MGNQNPTAGRATCACSPHHPSLPPWGQHPVVDRDRECWHGSEPRGQPGRQGDAWPQHCACCGAGLLRELVPVDRDHLSGNNCGCPFPQPFPGNLPARPVSNAAPVCRISTAVCAPLLIPLHNTPCASCPAERPGGRGGARAHHGTAWTPFHLLTC